tara:strand:+ start:40 stop:432 length:393 start_codon:yes stop_codon:yes gene_type:complete
MTYGYGVINVNSKNLNLFEFSNKISKEEFNKFKSDFDNLLNKQDKFLVVFNLLKIKSFDINFFLKKMDYIYKNKDLVKMYMSGSTIVISNKYLGILKFGLAMKKPLCPNCVTEDLRDGMNFLVKLNDIEE